MHPRSIHAPTLRFRQGAPKGRALAVLVLVAHSVTTAQGFGLPLIQSSEARPHELNPALQLYADRSLVTASGDEPQEAPKTFVDMSPAELAKAVPELKHLEPAENQDPLPQILQRVGADVGAFFDNFPNTTCTERVTSMVDTAFGAGAFHHDDKYNYLALAQAGAKKGRLREFRTDDKGALVQPDARETVVTVGFVAMSVHFHPDYQPDSRFRYNCQNPKKRQNRINSD